MVEITSRRSLRVYRVLDREGKPIGQVIQPKASPIVGVGARTVLLVRSEREGERLLRS